MSGQKYLLFFFFVSVTEIWKYKLGVFCHVLAKRYKSVYEKDVWKWTENECWNCGISCLVSRFLSLFCYCDFEFVSVLDLVFFSFFRAAFHFFPLLHYGFAVIHVLVCNFSLSFVKFVMHVFLFPDCCLFFYIFCMFYRGSHFCFVSYIFCRDSLVSYLLYICISEVVSFLLFVICFSANVTCFFPYIFLRNWLLFVLHF